ncbi:hypothetical protein T10_2528 [Trichinella papuae]|uniref:Uncharacterized protein n=1 Tax=Trichinella papuae TaxID=268474 RepID=A0A0V1M917_9BILA|nr:hypothetical protein T10_2528 [Trichinella papuae]
MDLEDGKAINLDILDKEGVIPMYHSYPTGSSSTHRGGQLAVIICVCGLKS